METCSNMKFNTKLFDTEALVQYNPVAEFPVIFVQVKKATLQVSAQTVFAPKGRSQRHSKIAEAQNLEKIVLI